ncbi:MarR family winged helix-turn-helix transcriptional regulator [Bacillus sp. WLY-B-L8]|uniref:MarR family winged helix-turn-helix transcriptional regulator n=1 Tax=Bacillus multifaciens TaxID=3068506 RepID=UPI002741DB05|nr:MarR family transcriptional regulator [Bacillus sp. WLY-B-L8]MDP7977683.1 MarR family transcriptional regulator [Bacillus sp. WLY-B-L8]
METLNIIKNWNTLSRTYITINNELDVHLQSKYKLSINEFNVLWLLSEQPEKKMRIQYIADAVSLSQSAVSRLVSRLEHSLVERHICETDQRGVYIKLTTLGQEQIDEIITFYQNTLLQLLIKSDISQEMTVLLSSLNPLMKHYPTK